MAIIRAALLQGEVHHLYSTHFSSPSDWIYRLDFALREGFIIFLYDIIVIFICYLYIIYQWDFIPDNSLGIVSKPMLDQRALWDSYPTAQEKNLVRNDNFLSCFVIQSLWLGTLSANTHMYCSHVLYRCYFTDVDMHN